MGNYRGVIAILTVPFVFFVLYSCESTNSGLGSSDLSSSYNSSKSHRVGENCMNCHVPSGSGDGVFSVAGTVYNESLSSPLPNSTVRFYSTKDEDAAPLYVIEVDAKGNFYTTEDISFGEGLYTSVQGSGAEIFMESAVTNGSCNSCHGITTDRIRGE
jgi:cytochrome c peroxidase